MNNSGERDLASGGGGGCVVDEDQAMGGEDEEGGVEREERRGAIGIVGLEINAWKEVTLDLGGEEDRTT